MTTKFWKVPFKIEGEVEVAAETEELAFNRVTHHMDIGEIAEHGDLITYPAEFDAQTTKKFDVQMRKFKREILRDAKDNDASH
jgi:hypothetical protein